MRLRAYTPILWRSPSQAQVGMPYGNHVVFDHLTDEEQRFLAKIPTLATELDVKRAARWCAVAPERSEKIINTLWSADLLVDGKEQPRTRREKTWETLGLSVDKEHARRNNRCVTVCGTSPLAVAITELLAKEGVGELCLISDDTILNSPQRHTNSLESEHHLNIFCERLATMHPELRVGRRWSSDSLVVVVSSGAIDPAVTRVLQQSATPAFLIVDNPGGVTLGPLVNSSGGACGMCLDLWRTEHDECWPALVAQLISHPSSLCDPISLAHASALACQAIIDCLDNFESHDGVNAQRGQENQCSLEDENEKPHVQLDGHPRGCGKRQPYVQGQSPWVGKTLTLSVGSSHTQTMMWPRHPHCACSWTCSQVISESVD
ncbi:hypothetical protein [Actinomyces vulturis]|uniref:hypothetical protein n=1 Tax=Actinomyces vulturis TaxID=1857645 RepID=UPI00114612C2|nr:hypothetical protein [Actinomyces vulturis]